MKRITHTNELVSEDHNGSLVKVNKRDRYETARLLRLTNELSKQRVYGYKKGKVVYNITATSLIEAGKLGRIAAYPVGAVK